MFPISVIFLLSWGTFKSGCLAQKHKMSGPFINNWTSINNNTSDRATETLSPRPTISTLDVSETHILKAGSLKEACITHNGTSHSNTSLILSFKVDSLSSCSDYCKFTQYCALFTFQIYLKTCCLHKETDPIFYKDINYNLAQGNMACLNCLGTVENIVERSKHGIIIENIFNKCLSVTNETVVVNGTTGFKLFWKKICSKPDLWVFNWTNQTISDVPLVQISKLNTNWALDWSTSSAGNKVVFLTERIKIINSIVFQKTSSDEKTCKFNIDGIDTNGWTWLLQLVDDNIFFMQFLSFSLPNAKQMCPLSQFSVKNGEILNPNKVPFFLPETTCTVRCKPGFGVKTKNFTSYQDVICSKDIRPKPCSVMRVNNEHTSHILNFDEAVVLVIFSILVTCLMTLVGKKMLCHGDTARHMPPTSSVEKCRT